MNIEIVTTNKKLSKSLLKQMPRTTETSKLKFSIDNKTVLGYILDIDKDVQKGILIKTEDDYYIVPVRSYNRYKGTETVSPRVVFKLPKMFTKQKTFKDEESLDVWEQYYTIVKNMAKEHIYI